MDAVDDESMSVSICFGYRYLFCALCVRACCSQITVTSVEEIELLKEEVMSSPVLLRVWAEYVNNDYIGAAHPGPQFEGKTVLLAGCFRVLKHPPAQNTRSSATAKSTARPSCLVGVLYDISREKIC